MSDALTDIASPSQTAGPFFHVGLPPVSAADDGKAIRLVVRVTDGNASPVSDALIELWYVAHRSTQDETLPAGATVARASSDADGRCEFDLDPPARIADRDNADSSPHINVCLFARGLLRQLYTRIYFEGEPTLDRDNVLALVPPDRRHTLIARREAAHREQWRFDLRLQGDDETVFFAI